MLAATLFAASCATPIKGRGGANLIVYPPAPRAAVVDAYQGTRVADPYRWLESLDSPPTRAWIAAENALSMPRLASLAQRPWIKSRLQALTKYEHFGVPIKAAQHYFYTRNNGRQDQSVLYVASDINRRGRVLLDPNTMRRDATVALADFVPDWQGQRVAYSTSDGGTDWTTWRIRDAASGRDLSDVIHYTKFTRVSWAHDDSGFYYSRYPSKAKAQDGVAQTASNQSAARQNATPEGDDQRQALIYFHRLGDPQSRDRLIYAVVDHPTRVPYATVSEDGRYLIVSLDDGTLTSGISVVALDARGVAVQAGASVAPLLADWDALYTYIGSDGDQLYFTTTSQSPRGRIIAVDARHPERSHWRVIAPELAETLTQATYAGGQFFAVYLQDAHSVVRRFDGDGHDAGQIALPGLGTVAGFDGRRADGETYYSYTDFSTPARILRYDIAGKGSRDLWTPTLAADTRRYVTDQVFYSSRDGTRIPMFIVHRRDFQRDGNQPVLLYGYGGFDISLTPGFSTAALTWLEMGGVYAVANLRGGGEYGEAWHEAGVGARKQNVFDDFIGAAQYLINENYTRAARLAISGRSNGGLLIGAAITQRPDLFGAALPAVGVLDMLRYQLASANARQWSSDYGLSDNALDFAAQYAYSPYHNVRSGVCYPPTLVTTADHDDRVVPWHSFKFAAALQQAQGCAHPVLIRIDTRAGHGAGKPLWMQVEDVADQWAFAADALGMQMP